MEITIAVQKTDNADNANNADNVYNTDNTNNTDNANVDNDKNDNSDNNQASHLVQFCCVSNNNSIDEHCNGNDDEDIMNDYRHVKSATTTNAQQRR